MDTHDPGESRRPETRAGFRSVGALLSRHLLSVRGLAVLVVVLLVFQLASTNNPVQATRPEPPVDRDRDGDGVPDELDRCVALAGLPPAGCPPRDTDGDGVIDRDDRCLENAGPIANQGCPDTDGDQDGVVDRKDQCQDVPGSPRFSGCRAPDRDDDGIADPDDRCPEKAEIWNGKRDRDGCPDRGRPRILVTAARTVALDKLPFRRSGSLTSSGRKALATAARYAAAIEARRARVTIEHRPDKVPAPKVSARRQQALSRVLRQRRPALEVVFEQREATGKRPGVSMHFE